MVKTWHAILAAVIIFLAGSVSGAIISRLFFVKPPQQQSQQQKPPGPPGSRQRMDFAERLQKNLNLSQEQKQKIDQILKESEKRMKEIWDTVEPKFKEETQKTHNEIIKVLTPEQLTIFETRFRPPGSHNFSSPKQDIQRRGPFPRGPRDWQSNTNNTNSNPPPRPPSDN
jgi:hypothetical protein